MIKFLQAKSNLKKSESFIAANDYVLLKNEVYLSVRVAVKSFKSTSQKRKERGKRSSIIVKVYF